MDPLSVIASTIAVVQAISSTYKAIQHLRGLPKAFDEVNQSLPLVEDTLTQARNQLYGVGLNESLKSVIEPVISDCEEKAKALLDIFQKVDKGKKDAEDWSVLDVYRTAVLRLGKAHRVETLAQDILKRLRALAINQLFRTATQSQIARLDEAIQKLSDVESSMPDSDFESSVTTITQNIAKGATGYQPINRGHAQYNNFGDGRQFNAETMNFAALPDMTQTCLRDLIVTDPLEDKNALKRKKGDRAPGTCEWIVQTKELTAWLGSGQTAAPENQTDNVLWLHGNPGTGKSIMAIYLAEELSTAFSKTDEKTLVYFFCDSGFDTRKTATSVVRGLLLQLVQQHQQLLNYLLPKYNERGIELFKSFDALWAIFMAAAADRSTGRKYCIIDALDECDQESQNILMRQFRDTFRSPNDTLNVRILVTSRPYDEIRQYLKRYTNKDLASFPERKQDIDLCIEEKVKHLADQKNYTDKVQKQVSNILRAKAEGTFLWVGIACEELEGVASNRAVQVLQSMPEGLHSLYTKLLYTALKQNEDSRVDIRRILSCVAVCQRPLTVLELSEACQMHQDEEDIETRVQFTREHISSCRLMIIIQNEKVLLLHQSVKDYLVGAGSERFIEEPEAHARLAYRCVNLLIEQFHGTNQPRTSFLDYAIREWPNHARMARSTFEVKCSQAEFFQMDSPCREQWLQHLRANKVDIPKQFSIFHVAAKWGVSALVECDKGKWTPTTHVDCVDNLGVTPLQQAAKSGYPDVVSALLNLGGKVTTQLVKITAGNSGNGKEVMALLLDRRGDQIIIDDEVVKAAAGNWRNGKEVIELLLNRRGDQITITDEVVKAAVGNTWNGKEVMALLLDQPKVQIFIKDTISMVAKTFDKKVMALFLDWQGDQIITNEVIQAAAGNPWNGKEMMALLFDRRRDQIIITDEVVKAAARNWRNGKEVMALLLDRRGDQFTITDEVVKAAAGNFGNGKKIIKLLLDRREDQISITDEVIKAAAENPWNGKEVIALLLDRRSDQVIITDEVIKAAARNSRNGNKIMALLLDRPGVQILITDKAISTIAGSFDKEVMALLLDQRGDQIIITDEVVKAAAENWRNGEDVLALLLYRRETCGMVEKWWS